MNVPLFCGRDLAEWLERLTANSEVVTVLGSIFSSSTHWNLRGGRLSSVVYTTVHRKNPNFHKSIAQNYFVK
jgi:hypothetical protein